MEKGGTGEGDPVLGIERVLSFWKTGCLSGPRM